MKKKELLYPLLVFVVACATPRAPTGGQKDTEAPKVVSTTPDSAAINFSGQTLVLKFDEYFTTTNIQSQLIFSPPLKYTPKFKTNKKSLIILQC